AKVRVAQCARDFPAQLGERIRNDGYRRHPSFFQLDGVVDTPRRAGASIRDGVDDVIAARRECGKIGQRASRTGLRDAQRLAVAAKPAYSLFNRVEKVRDIGLAVVDESDYNPLRTPGAGCKSWSSLRFARPLGIEHSTILGVHRL